MRTFRFAALVGCLVCLIPGFVLLGVMILSWLNDCGIHVALRKPVRLLIGRSAA